jgi:hypothetical protein
MTRIKADKKGIRKLSGSFSGNIYSEDRKRDRKVI